MKRTKRRKSTPKKGLTPALLSRKKIPAAVKSDREHRKDFARLLDDAVLSGRAAK